MLLLSNRSDLGIKITGLRKGEKLYEELLNDENDVKTQYESIFVVKSEKVDLTWLTQEIQNLQSSQDIPASLLRIVPEFKHNKEGI